MLKIAWTTSAPCLIKAEVASTAKIINVVNEYHTLLQSVTWNIS